MTVQLSSLRVVAEFDASAYTTGAAQKAAADQKMVQSGQQVAATVTQTETKITQAGDVLSRLSRQYVDGYAAAQRFNTALNQLGNGVERGNITIAQSGPILDGIYRRYGLMGDAAMFAARGQTEFANAITRANARLVEQGRIPAAANQNRLSGGQVQGLGYQANDIVTQALLGASPQQIAFSQGGQILQTLQMGEGGIRGSLAAIRGSIAAATTATVAFLGPLGLIATGFGAAAAAAGIFYLASGEKTKSITDALEDQRKAVTDLAEAYGMVAAKAQASGVIAGAAVRQNQTQLAASLRVEGEAAFGQLGRFVTPGKSAGGFSQLKSEFQDFAGPLLEIQKEIRQGRPDFDRFEQSIEHIVDQNPGLRGVADTILVLYQNAANAARALEQANGMLDQLNKIRRPEAGNLSGMDSAVNSLRADELSQIRRMNLQFDAERAGLSAKTPEERAAAARQREAATFNDREGPEARSRRIEIAGTMELIRATKELQDAEEQRRQSAIDGANERIKSQKDEIELLRAETDLVGQSRGVHDARIASIRTEQEIRKLGIPLYGEEANAIRQNSTEIAALSEQQKLAQEAWEKSQKAAQEAARLTQEAWAGVFGTINDGIDSMVDALFDGTKSFEDTLKDIGRQFARLIFDMAVTNPLKNALTGSQLPSIADLGIFGAGASSGRTGQAGGLIGSLFGLGGRSTPFTPNTTLSAVLGGAANDNGVQSYIQKRIDGAFSDVLSGGGGSNTLVGSGGNVSSQVWNFFKGKGLSDTQVAGIMGNVSAESAFRPGAIGDGGNALGLFQWNDRRNAMKSFVGSDWKTDVNGQLNFAWKELQSSEQRAFKNLLGSDDVRGATGAFAGFERPRGFSYGNPEGADRFGARLSGARGALSQFGGTGSVKATDALDKLAGAGERAASSLHEAGLSGFSMVKGLTDASGGLSHFGSLLSNFMGAGGGSGSGWFQGLASIFGGAGGAISHMMGISPGATGAILAGGALGPAGLYATGGVFNHGNVVPFARGDVLTSPGYFPMSGGRTGLMGEAGPEAIMPLRRMSDGRLGVASHGGHGGQNIDLDALASKLQAKFKIINLFDPSTVGDYMRMDEGEKAVVNVQRRAGTGGRLR